MSPASGRARSRPAARGSRRRLVGVLGVLLAGCGAGPLDPEDLELVRLTAAAAERAPPETYTLRVEARAPAEADLWVPLPGADGFQEVRSLLLEVAPPGEHRVVTGSGGDRALRVSAPDERRARVVLQARIQRADGPPAATPALPAPARDDLPPELAPRAYVEAVRERGVAARLAHGVRNTSQGGTELRSWAEVRVGDRWLPVDPGGPTVRFPPGCVRLGGALPRAERDGAPVEVEVDYRLERVD